MATRKEPAVLDRLLESVHSRQRCGKMIAFHFVPFPRPQHLLNCLNAVFHSCMAEGLVLEPAVHINPSSYDCRDLACQSVPPAPLNPEPLHVPGGTPSELPRQPAGVHQELPKIFEA